jgi:hypothetical protein
MIIPLSLSLNLGFPAPFLVEEKRGLGEVNKGNPPPPHRPCWTIHYPHVTLRYVGMQVLPVAWASSPRRGIISTAGRGWPWPMVCRHEPGATKRLRTGIAFIPDRLYDRNKHIQHSRDQDGERSDTRRIVSAAGAAAWLPHSKPRDTRMASG